MKKLLSTFIALVLVFSAVACSNGDDTGNETKESKKNQDSTEVTEADTTSKSKEKENEEPEDVFDDWHQVPDRDIYINFNPRKRRDSVMASSLLFHSTGIDCVALAYDRESIFSGTYSEVFDILNDGRVFKDISLYSLGMHFGSDSHVMIQRDKTKVTKINGIDAEWFEGTAGDNGEHYVYGYCFVYDDTPCMLVGIILNYAEHQDLKEPLKIEVDRMSETIRADM